MHTFTSKILNPLSVSASLICGTLLSVAVAEAIAEEVIVEEIAVVPAVEVIPVVQTVEPAYRDLLKREIKKEMQQEEQLKNAQKKAQTAERVASQAKKGAQKANIEAQQAKQKATKTRAQLKAAEQRHQFEKRAEILQGIRQADQDISYSVKLAAQQLGGVVHDYREAGLHAQTIEFKITRFTADVINTVMKDMKPSNIPMQIIFPVRGEAKDLKMLVQNLSPFGGISILPMTARFESKFIPKAPTPKTDKNEQIVVCISSFKYPEAQLLATLKETQQRPFTTDTIEISRIITPLK